MYSVVAAEAWAAEDLWAQAVASRALREALDLLTRAGAESHALAAASDWKAKGVRMLHRRLDETVDQVLAQSGAVQRTAWSLEEACR